MVHTYRCANSLSTPKERCECACDKKLHGIPHSERASALFGSSDNSDISKIQKYSKYKVKELKSELNEANKNEYDSKLTDLTTAIIVDTLLEKGDTQALTSLRDKLGEITITLFIESITEEIETPEYKLEKEQLQKLNEVLQHSHFFCALCCEILKLIEKIEDKACELVADTVREYLKCAHEDLDPIEKELIIAVAKNIAKKVINKFEKLLNIDSYKEATSLLALICCPNILEHEDVLTYCLAPLIKKIGAEKFNSRLEQYFPTSHKHLIKLHIEEEETKEDASTTLPVGPEDANDSMNAAQSADSRASETNDLQPLTDTDTLHSPYEDQAAQDQYSSAGAN
jgi:hypothetical protein